MKNKYIISLFVATCLLTSCNSNNNNNKQKLPSFTLSETNLILTTDETKVISICEIEDQSLITWSSSNEAIASVYNGYVTAIADDGVTTIYAKYENYSASCEVTVYNPSMKSRIEILDNDVVISKNQEYTLTANIIFNNKVKEEESKHIEWKSTAPHIAQVISANENTCTILGKSVGDTTIIAYAYDKGIYISKSINVQIKEDIDGDYLMIANSEYSRSGYVIYLPATPYGNIDNKFTPKVLFNGDKDVSNEIVWKCDEEIISYNNGTLIANQSGSVTVTGTYSHNDSSIDVNLLLNVYKPRFTKDNMPMLDLEIFDLKDNHNSKVDLSYYLNVYDIKDEIIDIKLFEKDILLEYENSVAKLNLDLIPNDGKVLGENVLEFSTKKATFEIPTYVLSKRIYTKEDIDTYFKPFIDNNMNTSNNGLYVIESDIDYENGELTRGSYYPNTPNFPWGGTSGFAGIIEGQGHTISNFKTGLYGMFGKVNAAIIKNVNFSGVKYVAGYDYSILGNIAFGTTLENVNFDIAEADAHISVLSDCYGLIVSNYTANVILKGVTINTYCFDICSLFGSGKNNSQTLQGSETLIVRGTKPQRFCGVTIDLPNSSIFVPSIYGKDELTQYAKNDDSLISFNTGKFANRELEGIYANESCYKKFVNGDGTRTEELTRFLTRTVSITDAIKVTHSCGGEFTMFAKTRDGFGFYFTLTLYDKVLNSPSDFKEIFNSSKVNGAEGFTFGYYILDKDVDFANKECGDSIDPAWLTSGFGGTVNGLGHKIKNIKTSNGGLFNAFRGVLKDITFDNVTLTDRTGACLIGQFVQSSGCEIKNVKINIANSCTSTKSSIICSNYCVQAIFENIEIHAEGLDLPNIFGSYGFINEQSSAFIKFNNFHIYCNSIACFAYSGSSLGGDVITNAPSGIEINK